MGKDNNQSNHVNLTKCHILRIVTVMLILTLYFTNENPKTKGSA